MHHLSILILCTVVAVGCDHNWSCVVFTQTSVSVVSSMNVQSKKTINLSQEERTNLKTSPSAFIC